MKILTGGEFRKWIEGAGVNLANEHKHIDSLNVFPVPDGDTGTNMNLTFTSGMEQMRQVQSDRFDKIAKGFSRGLLMGARGNSGVILSQIFRGFAQSVDGKAQLTAADLAAAFSRGSEVAYKAIMRPVEGTILTVIRESSWYANDYVEKHPDADINGYMDVLVQEAEESLKRTPDLLPVLKEVGVLDSGGSGLVAILRGFQMVLNGEQIEAAKEEETAPEEEAEVGYRTQFWLKPDQLSAQDPELMDKLNLRLGNTGTDLVSYEEHGLIKASVNTLTPGQALNVAQRFGSFQKIQIDNLSLELNEPIVSGKAPHTKYAIIAVASGEGLTGIFKEMGASAVVTGGQTMNPSTSSFVDAIKQVDADHIILLPNNSNIILAAHQTASVLDKQDIRVVETKSIPQGLSALVSFDPDADIEDNMTAMAEAAKHALSGSVTYAVRDTTIEGMSIKAHDFMGMLDKEIVAVDPDIYKTTRQLIDHMLANRGDDYSFVTLIGGQGTDDSDLELLKHYIHKKYPGFEVEAYNGAQPVYSYLIGVD